jgi:group I intron endonuclease
LINFWPTKNNKNLASHIGETKKSPLEVNLKDSAVNNRDLKEEMSFLYNKYTKNNSNCFVFSPKTKLRTIKRHFSPATLPYQLTTILTILPLRFLAPFSTACSPATTAEVVYTDVVGEKETILKNNKGRAAGVYCWTNLITGKQYVGSSVNLKSRFYNYFSPKFLARHANKSIIHRALLKYGYSNFSLSILEYCDAKDAVSREQHYLDLLKPVNNIAQIAGSRLGVKCTSETKLKIAEAMKGRPVSAAKRVNISDAWASIELSEAHKAHLIELNKNAHSPERIAQAKKNIAEYYAKQAKTVEVTTTDTGNYGTYPSIKATADAVGANPTTISNYIKSKRTYLGKYNLAIKTTTRSMSTTTNTDNVPTLYKQKLTKVRVKALDNSSNKRVSPAIKKHTGTLEWYNSVYAYYSKRTILLSAIDKIVIKLIKSYFNAYFLSNKIRKLSVLNKITISKLEVKHTNYKVVILVYVYSAKLINLQFLYENLSNNTKFSLVGLLGRCYNKKVELRVIRLRDMHLNASILAERLANELNKKFMSPLRALRRVLKTVRIPKLNLKLHSWEKSLLSKKNLALSNSISTLNVKDLKKIPQASVRNEVLVSTKHKAITGLKIQIAGRLTRRAIAARAVVKGGQVGSLKNIDSSFLGHSVGLLRGHQRSNVQKAYHNGNTKNGAFNVRVWSASS